MKIKEISHSRNSSKIQ